MDAPSITCRHERNDRWGEQFVLYQGSTKLAEYVLGYLFGRHVVQITTTQLDVYSLLYQHEDYDADTLHAHLANSIQKRNGNVITEYSSGVLGVNQQAHGKIFLLDDIILGYVATCWLPDSFTFDMKASLRGELTNSYSVHVLYSCPSEHEAKVARLLALAYADTQHRIERQEKETKPCQRTPAQLNT